MEIQKSVYDLFDEWKGGKEVPPVIAEFFKRIEEHQQKIDDAMVRRDIDTAARYCCKRDMMIRAVSKYSKIRLTY